MSLASLLFKNGWATDRGMEELEAWFARYYRLGRDLAAHTITQEAWQHGMDGLFGSYSSADLMARIDFGQLSRKLKESEKKGRREIFSTILIDDQPAENTDAKEPKQKIITKIAYIEKGGSIPPHGHNNMVSAFLHLSGEFHVRQFNKLGEDDGAMLVQPRPTSWVGQARGPAFPTFATTSTG